MDSTQIHSPAAPFIVRLLRSARLWRITLALLLCVVTALALMPQPPQQADLGWDKLNHLAAFVSLTVVAALGFVRGWIWVAGGMFAFGVLIEALQAFTPNRSASWQDLLADLLGIALGFLVALSLLKVTSRYAGRLQ